ncbi:uncharacterized protein ACB058_009722 [Synchiropus picturatus]
MLLLSLLVCLCFYVAGSHAENCTQAVLARRAEISSTPGSTLLLTCVVQHCGGNWGGSWVRRNSSSQELETVSETESRKISVLSISRNKTQLQLSLDSLDKSDEGSYGCRIKWSSGGSDQGHLVHVTIIGEEQLPRNPWHRVLVCSSAFLCLPIILLLAWCLRPRTSPVKQEALLQENELVYANISRDALSSQCSASRETQQLTIYSTVQFVPVPDERERLNSQK